MAENPLYKKHRSWSLSDYAPTKMSHIKIQDPPSDFIVQTGGRERLRVGHNGEVYFYVRDKEYKLTEFIDNQDQLQEQIKNIQEALRKDNCAKCQVLKDEVTNISVKYNKLIDENKENYEARKKLEEKVTSQQDNVEAYKALFEELNGRYKRLKKILQRDRMAGIEIEENFL